MGTDLSLLVVLICCILNVMVAAVDREVGNVTSHMDILMRGAKPSQPDAYLCTSYPVEEEEAYIVKFEALASADTAHHILIYGCQDTGISLDDIWGCPPVCRNGPQQIMFAWAKNAPPTQLPDGVGFRIGRRTSIRTIVMQIHYARSFEANEEPDRSGIRLHISHEKQPYVAGIFLMMSYNFAVPPNRAKFHVDMSCRFNRRHSIFPFAYRTHAHLLGRVITGYQFNDTGYHMIGKGNPQWPQAFYPTNTSVEVKQGDMLVARCTYNSTGMHRTVQVGATNNEEMCNFYIMFYTDSSVKKPYGECGGVQFQGLVDHMPADSDVTLPPNPVLDAMAHGHHHHHAMAHPSTSSSSSNHNPKPTGASQAQDIDQEFNSQQKWFDLPNAGSYPHNDALMQYLARTIYNNKKQFEDLQPDMDQQSTEEELPHYFDSQRRRFPPIDVQKRMGGEYYDDYAANDEREKGTFPEANPGLSRNRNKAFEAMNQELKGFQHIKPHGDAPDSGYWQQQYPQTQSRKKIGTMPLAPNVPPLGNHLPVEPLSGKLSYQSDWPSEPLEIGQVSGVATDSKGNVYIFHRGKRVWDRTSFDYDSNFRSQSQPIKEDVVVILSRDGKLIRKFGSGEYFMPHGIAVDDKGNIWLTDVALHQVFRIQAGESKPNLTLGERFVHKEDAAHFCKPTDVAVLSSGEFFVSDGYCHSRIMKFSKEGNLMKEWGQPNDYRARIQPPAGSFNVPHSITVAEDLGLLFVADRENGRIQSFDLNGNFRFIIQHPEFGLRLFAVEYCPRHGGLLFAVNGPNYDGTPVIVSGFTIGIRDNRLMETWNLPTALGLQNPHDVAVDVEGHAVYVGELDPTSVWKFQRPVPAPSTTTAATQKAAGVSPPAAQSTDKDNKASASGKGKEEEEKTSMAAKAEDSRKAPVSGGLVKETKAEEVKEDSSDFTPSIIIGVLLVIPVVLLLVITLVLRWHHRGWDSCFSSMRTPKVFNLQNFLGNSHRGFDKLSQEDSDHDADVLSDSDNEEFRQPMKSKA